MEQNGGSDWWAAAVEIAKYILGALATVASSAVLWMARRYHGHIAMLNRHEDRLNQNDYELGEQRKFREQARSAPIGDAMIKELNRFREEDELLHKRISDDRKRFDTYLERFVKMEAMLDMIYDEVKDHRHE